MAQDTIRVLRILEYTGPRDAVEDQINKSIHGIRLFGFAENTVQIRATTLGQFADILSKNTNKVSPGDNYEFCRMEYATQWYDFQMKVWKDINAAGYHMPDNSLFRRPKDQEKHNASQKINTEENNSSQNQNNQGTTSQE